MNVVHVTNKKQITISTPDAEVLGLKPGQEYQVVPDGDQIVLVPTIPIEKARGMLKGIDTDVPREPDREF